jgi:hypothetical protein
MIFTNQKTSVAANAVFVILKQKTGASLPRSSHCTVWCFTSASS